MYRPVAVLLVAGLALPSWSCFGGASDSSAGSCSPPEQLSSDTLVAAHHEHALTLDERKAAAVLWVAAAMTAQSDGRLADAFAISDVGDRLSGLADAYASVNACASTVPESPATDSRAATSALSSCEEFACDTSCWPDAGVFGSAAKPALTLLKKIGGKLVASTQPTGEQAPIWNTMYLRLHMATLDLVANVRDGTSSISKRVGDALVNGLSEDDVKAIEKIVSTVVSTTKDIADAKAKAGVANAVLIAEVCSGFEAALLAKQLADGLEPARQLVADCWFFKSRYCGADPPCSNPDPCAKQIGNACLADTFRAPDGPSDLPFTPVPCLDQSNPGGCPHPSRDGGPIEPSDAGRDASLPPRDAGTIDAGLDAGPVGTDGGIPDAGVDSGTPCCCTFDALHYCGSRYDPCWSCVNSSTPIDGSLCGATCNAPIGDQCVSTCP